MIEKDLGGSFSLVPVAPGHFDFRGVGHSFADTICDEGAHLNSEHRSFVIWGCSPQPTVSSVAVRRREAYRDDVRPDGPRSRPRGAGPLTRGSRLETSRQVLQGHQRVDTETAAKINALLAGNGTEAA